MARVRCERAAGGRTEAVVEEGVREVERGWGYATPSAGYS